MPTTESSSEPHIAVLAFPFASHPVILLNIVRSLATAAPNVHFSYFGTAKSNSSTFSASKHDVVHAPNIKAYDVEDGVPKDYVFIGKPLEDIELFMNAARENFRKAVEAAETETGRKVSCLVSDAFVWIAAEMAEEMAVPWLPCWTSGQNSLATHVYTDLIRHTIGLEDITGREDETLEFIPVMSKIRIQDLPEGIVFGNLNSFFSNMLHQVGLVLPRATAIFVNSFEELDPELTNDLKSKFKNFLNVGPYNFLPQSPSSSSISDAYGCLPWLDNQKAASVAYISFGTVATPSPTEIVALAEALETSGVTFLWSLKDSAKAHLPNGFMEKAGVNGMIVPWAPQVEVLAHGAIGVFISHCGWNSMIESIAGGVPMICRPFFGDHRINARFVEAVLEIGLNVEGGIFTKNELVGNLDLILAQEKGKKMREKIKSLKEVIEKAVGSQGSSTNNLKILLNIISRPN